MNLSQVPACIDGNQSFPKQLQLGLVRAVLPDISDDADIELSITLQNTNVNLRQLAALLTITDRFYSHMSYNGVYNYARLENEQIRIKEFKLGSVEIVLSSLKYIDPARIILLWLLIKYLPQALVSFSTVVSNFAKAFHDYQDGQHIREARKALRENLKKDNQLEKLDKRQLAKLTSLMTYLYARESRYLVQAEKCIKNNMKSIEVRKRKN